VATCRDDQQQSLSTATGKTSVLADLLQPEAMGSLTEPFGKKFIHC
jgi:hypothetical protein